MDHQQLQTYIKYNNQVLKEIEEFCEYVEQERNKEHHNITKEHAPNSLHYKEGLRGPNK